jgi:hypothetical protein
MLLATVYKDLPRGLCYSSTRNKALKNDEINIRDSPYSTAWQSPGHSKWTFDNAKEADDIKSLRRMEEARLNRRRTPAQKVLEKPAVITQIPAQLEKCVVSNALLLVDKPQVPLRLDGEAIGLQLVVCNLSISNSHNLRIGPIKRLSKLCDGRSR